MATFPGATWRPGPRSKQGYDGGSVNACTGVILHSMVGSFAGAMGRLDSTDRASWHYSITQDGRIFAHYSDETVTWHAGARIWNQRLIGIEHEGGAPGNESEPLTAPQKAASVALVRWLSKTHGFPLVRFNGLAGNLFEHCQVYATACPSGRIPWAAYTPEEEDEMKPMLVWAIDSQKMYLVGPWGASWITRADDVTVLEGLYGKATTALHEATLHSIGTVAVTSA